jgi:hypothetical protein
VRDLSHDANPVRKYAGALAWHAGRILGLLPSDLIHLHYGRRTSYLRLWPRRPYVLHFQAPTSAIASTSPTPTTS